MRQSTGFGPSLGVGHSSHFPRGVPKHAAGGLRASSRKFVRLPCDSAPGFSSLERFVLFGCLGEKLGLGGQTGVTTSVPRASARGIVVGTPASTGRRGDLADGPLAGSSTAAEIGPEAPPQIELFGSDEGEGTLTANHRLCASYDTSAVFRDNDRLNLPPGDPRRRIRLQLGLAYEGTRFAGLQFQPRPTRTVQGVVESAARAAFGADIGRMVGASRTDGGVHALHQVAHLDIPAHFLEGCSGASEDATGSQGNVQDTASPFQEVSAPHGAVAAPSDRLQAALCTLNIKLPADVRVHSAKVAPAGFDANQDATGKVYHYHIASEQRPDPWDAPFRWWILPVICKKLRGRPEFPRQASLNVEAMQAVAALLQSRQDFTALSDPRKRGEKADNVRRLHRVEVCRADSAPGHVLIILEGDGFLYKMCRKIVSMLVEVGAGLISLEECARLISSRDPTQTPKAAPACGLFLVNVMYDRNAGHSDILKEQDDTNTHGMTSPMSAAGTQTDSHKQHGLHLKPRAHQYQKKVRLRRAHDEDESELIDCF
ncbi:hypothetical protein CYMTET_30219 [Cymbomonas tetramitiformis]|uniref:Pseudouridine synthase I TruA alpha/beta domain-containing protein n=1 Tax=Cymbomonas tetramitiformis TaxID=36881 RepID=A0AAE0FJE5_9CHLO|nr:hypothetical protein CYMTET_30219 [Cymbomonas tetramitiformis]